MKPEEIAAIEQRVEAATEGPWERDRLVVQAKADGVAIADFEWAPRDESEYAEMHADAEFAAHARTDVPALLAEVERLTLQGVVLRSERGTLRQQRHDDQDITPTVAAHVLFHFGAGGMKAGSFTHALIELIARADPVNRARLAAGHPAYVAAVEKAQMTESGVAELVMIAQEAGLGGGEGR